MKTRSGFVSNSSSSSFIVRMPAKDDDTLFKGMYKPSELMTPADVKKVLEFGFRPTVYRSPSSLEGDNWTWKTEEETEKVEVPTDAAQLGYCVTCNEDEVIEFLVRNNIPFSGSTHYGHSSVFYQRGSKTLLWMDNLGVQYEMYGHGNSAMSTFLLDHNKKFKHIRREAVSNYKPRR